MATMVIPFCPPASSTHCFVSLWLSGTNRSFPVFSGDLCALTLSVCEVNINQSRRTLSPCREHWGFVGRRSTTWVMSSAIQRHFMDLLLILCVGILNTRKVHSSYLEPRMSDSLINSNTEWKISLCPLRLFSCRLVSHQCSLESSYKQYATIFS